MKKATAEKARTLKNQMKARRRTVRATLRELALLLQCKANEDFTPMRNTKLYKNHGAEYCEYLLLI